jgi:metal-sulfur cluster biosynthetic enzyme
MAIDINACWDVLRTVYDPEIPVNVVELGLVYRLEIVGDDRVEVDMTVTSPMCPAGPQMIADARQKLLSVPGVKEAQVNLVWEPLWNPDMMSDEAKAELGYYG